MITGERLKLSQLLEVCFSGENQVETLHKGSVKISELEYGDMIKTYDPVTKQTTFTKFINYLHVDKSIVAEYISIETSHSSLAVKISPLHLIPRLKRSVKQQEAGSFVKSDIEFVFAKDLRHGDMLFTSQQDDMNGRVDRIVQLDHVREEGAYAPLTESGTLFVNNFFASCYANTYSHDLAHMVFKPVRLWSKYVNGLLSNSNKYFDQLSDWLVSTAELEGGSGMYWYAKALLDLIKYVPNAASFVKFS